MTEKNPQLSDNEWAILQVVWDRQPCTAPDVQESLQHQKGWAYTTVKTMMDRMVNKHLLKVEKIRNLHFYKTAITLTQAKKGEIMRTLKRAFNESLTPMMQFLIENNQLSDADFTELERLIKSRKPTNKCNRKKH